MNQPHPPARPWGQVAWESHPTVKASGQKWEGTSPTNKRHWEAVAAGVVQASTPPRPSSKPSKGPEHLLQLIQANHTQEELSRAYLRYELVRGLNPRTFTAIYNRNLTTGRSFDQIIDDAISSWKGTK